MLSFSLWILVTKIKNFNLKMKNEKQVAPLIVLHQIEK